MKKKKKKTTRMMPMQIKSRLKPKKRLKARASPPAMKRKTRSSMRMT